MTPDDVVARAAAPRRIDIVADAQGREWFQLSADRPIASVERTTVTPPHVLTEGMHYEPVLDRSGVRVIGWVHQPSTGPRRFELVALVVLALSLLGVPISPLFVIPAVAAAAVLAAPLILWRNRP